MYDSFFEYLLAKKKDVVDDIVLVESERAKNLREQYSLLENELKNQNDALTKSNKPTTRKTITNNIVALEGALKKVSKEISLSESKLKVTTVDPIKEMAKLYLSLKENPDIKSLTISESSKILTIETVNLLARNTYIGEYVISINFKSEAMRIVRKDRKKYMGHPHPFIGDDGNICFGTAEESAQAALEQGGFYSLVLMTLELLKYTQSGAYPYVGWTEFRTWVIKNTDQR